MRKGMSVVLGLGFLVLLGIGSGTGAARAQGVTQVTLTLTEFSISPATIEVPLGQPIQVTLVNAGKYPHNIKFELPAKSIEQTLLPANLNGGENGTGSYTFTTAGDWEMYCPVDGHEAKGMKGTVHVSSAASGGLPTTGVPALDGQVALVAAGLLLAAVGLGLRRRADQGKRA